MTTTTTSISGPSAATVGKAITKIAETGKAATNRQIIALTGAERALFGKLCKDVFVDSVFSDVEILRARDLASEGCDLNALRKALPALGHPDLFSDDLIVSIAECFTTGTPPSDSSEHRFLVAGDCGDADAMEEAAPKPLSSAHTRAIELVRRGYTGRYALIYTGKHDPAYHEWRVTDWDSALVDKVRQMAPELARAPYSSVWEIGDALRDAGALSL